MLRRLLREGVRATKDGKDPKGWVRELAGAIETFTQDTVLPIPQTGDEEQDKQLLREVGQRVAAGNYSVGEVPVGA